MRPRVGKFHVGRWYSTFVACSPQNYLELNDVYRSNTGLLRYQIEKRKDLKSLYRTRPTFYEQKAKPVMGAGGDQLNKTIRKILNRNIIICVQMRDLRAKIDFHFVDPT